MTKAAAKQEQAEEQQEYKTIQIGTPTWAYPTREHIHSEGTITQPVYRMLIGEGAPLTVTSTRSEEEVLGLAFRDMPTPGMLEIFRDGLLLREPTSKRKLQFVIGSAGAGKSFLATLISKMRDPRGPILVDCGGRDLSELLCETVLDMKAGQPVFDALDEKLAAGEMNPLNIARLRDALGMAMSEEDGKYSIDWETAGNTRYDPKDLETGSIAIADQLGLSQEDLIAEAPENQDKIADYRTKVEALENQLLAAAVTRRDNMSRVLQEVASLEKINTAGASISITTRDGPLIRAYKEGREVILDEYNKAKPGTDDRLQVLWQVFNGEMESHTVMGGKNRPFTFDRATMPEGFFITLTGNLTKDGYSTRSLSASAYQRLQPVEIRDPKVEDWQHRICQKLTGVPISTLHDAEKERWQGKNSEFGKRLIEIRKMGLTPEQEANIPSWQFAMLQNWQDVEKASKQLAEFYFQWAELLNPDGEKEGEAASIEIDRDFANRVAVGMRLMMKHIDDACRITPEGVDPSERQYWLEDVQAIQNGIMQEVEEHFGTRLSRTIMNSLRESMESVPKAYRLLYNRAGDAGLFEIKMKEGATSKDKLISGYLDINQDKERVIPENIAAAHAVLCAYLREQYPEKKLSGEDEDLVNKAQFEHVLSQLASLQEVDRGTHRSSVIYLPNVDIKNWYDEPLTEVVSSDAPDLLDMPSPEDIDDYDFGTDDEEEMKARRKIAKEILKEEEGLEKLGEIGAKDLADASRLLVSLALPGVGSHNIKALWSEYSHSCDVPTEENTVSMIASNASSTGLGTNLLRCKVKDADGSERDEYLHIVHDRFGNDGKGYTLVTGTVELSSGVVEALKGNGVCYVNRSQPDAEAKIGEALTTLLQSKGDIPRANISLQKSLSLAITFRLKNDITVTKQHANGKPVFDKETLFELPHSEAFDEEPATAVLVIPDERRAKDTENLVALLADRGGYLAKAHDYLAPFVVTASKDMDKLKHTLKALDAKPKAAAAGR